MKDKIRNKKQAKKIENSNKYAGRNINNLRYADDITLMAEKRRGTQKPLDESERGE